MGADKSSGLSGEIVLQGKELQAENVVFEAGAILLLAVAALVIGGSARPNTEPKAGASLSRPPPSFVPPCSRALRQASRGIPGAGTGRPVSFVGGKRSMPWRLAAWSAA